MRLGGSLFLLASVCSLLGCQHYGLDVRRIQLNKSSLASTFAHTPDPRQERPPTGQQLYIEWNYEDPSIIKEGSRLILKVIYADFHEEVFSYPIQESRGELSFFHMKMEAENYSSILTYQVEIMDPSEGLIDTFTHRMWFKLIPIEKDF